MENLFEDNEKMVDDEEIDKLLLKASQKYESELQSNGSEDEEIDKLLVEASQRYESEANKYGSY